MTDDTANSPATFTRSHRGDPMTPVPADAAMNALSAEPLTALEMDMVRLGWVRGRPNDYSTDRARWMAALVPRLLATLDAAREAGFREAAGDDALYERVAALLCQHVADAPNDHHATAEAIDAYHGVTARTIVRIARSALMAEAGPR